MVVAEAAGGVSVGGSWRMEASSRSESAFGDDPRMPQQHKGNNNGNNYWERKISDKNQARNCAGAFWRVELAFRETGLFQAPLKSTRGIHCS
jgi:hypothetical protein